jgi:hypothetical protein
VFAWCSIPRNFSLMNHVFDDKSSPLQLFVSTQLRVRPWSCVSFAAYVALEKQLESLGLRWSSVCRAVEERALALQNALAQWKKLDSLYSSLDEWLLKTEQIVAQMPTVDVSTDIVTVVEQVRLLKVLQKFIHF